MTNSWTDIKNTDLVVIMGGNAAEAHPCGFKWVTEAKANRGAKLIVVDPRFTRSAAVADFYAPIRPGTDIAFLLGVINYLHRERQDPAGVRARPTPTPSYIVKDGFAFNDGLFTGYDEEKRDYDRSRPGTTRSARTASPMVDDDAAESALRLEPAEGACRASTRPRWSSASAARRRTSS